MIKIDCQKYADEIIEQVKQIPSKQKGLLILTAGDDPASAAYMKGKMKDCEQCGIPVTQVRVENQKELMAWISLANWSDNVGGIIVQLPLPEGFNEQEAVNAVRIDKDVDGFKQGSRFLPCTPEGIMYLLHKEVGDLAGKRALVIGRGKLVGKPIAQMLLDADCTVTVAHSKTDCLNWELQNAEIVISAVGKPNTVDLCWCWNAEVVIDVGVNRDESGKLCGDCYDFRPGLMDYPKVTTVPGGVGLMTRAMLMKHMGEVNRRDTECS